MSFDIKLTNGDFVIKNGDVQQVTNTDKLIQDVLKLCFTEIGSNPIHPWYGSYLSKTLIGSAMDVTMLTTIAKSQLTSSLDNLKALQAAQIKSFQRMTAAEQISAIQDISITRSEIDPRLFEINVSVLTKNLLSTNVSFKVSTI